jgi:hypothetical protein
MVDLDFQVNGVEIEEYSASPLLLFCLRVTNRVPTVAVQNVLLNCQVRIDPVRRQYNDEEHERLVELFGEPRRWRETLRSLLWTHANVAIPAFVGETLVRLPVPCTHDFNIASAKYFKGLLDGEVPLTLLFSGSVFYRKADGPLQVEQIPWSKEAAYRLPVSVWRSLMETYYFDKDWLMLGHETFDRLYRFKRELRHLTFDDTLKYLLDTRAKDIAS